MIYLIVRLAGLALRIVNLAVWVYCILSWVANANPTLYKAYRFLGRFVEPVLAPIRRLIMPLTYKMGIDFSPLVLAFIISFVYRILISLLFSLSGFYY